MDADKLVILLIKEELRNKRLVVSLENMGFDCSFYALNVSQVILELAGFSQRSEELYSWYFSLTDKAIEEITFWNLYETLEKWANKIFNELNMRKEQNKDE